jgi:hypothetical protein
MSVDSISLPEGTCFIQLTTSFEFKIIYNGDTLVENEYYPSDLIIDDFNNDGYPDIRTIFMGHIPLMCDLFLFDSVKQQFTKVKNFRSVADPKNLLGTNLHYSYSKGGCADFYWYSYLFTIEDFELVLKGKIYGDGCNKDQDSNKILIYKITNEKTILFEKEEYDKIDLYPNYKWGYIEAYWRENYKSFLD